MKFDFKSSLLIFGVLTVATLVFGRSPQEAVSATEKPMVVETKMKIPAIHAPKTSQPPLPRPPVPGFTPKIDSKGPTSAQEPYSYSGGQSVALNDLEPPKTFLQSFGERAERIWDAIVGAPEEKTRKSSLSVPIASDTEHQADMASIGGIDPQEPDQKLPDGSPSPRPIVKRGAGKRYVTWRLRSECKGEKIAGFIAKTYSEKQEVLKQTFLPVEKGDELGCGEYRRPLEEFLPKDITDFKGYLTITGINEGKKELETLWQNLIKPSEMSIDEYGPGVVTLTWDQNMEPDLAGYKFYFGRVSGKYTHTVDIGRANTFKVTGLVVGTWYFTCTAYDKSGNESGYANEVSKEVKDPRPIVRERNN